MRSWVSGTAVRWLSRCGVLILCLVAGCSRAFYRETADTDAEAIVWEKSCPPWELPDSYTIQPDPRSRLFDPSDPDCPALPPPIPQLYDYVLPLSDTPQEDTPPHPEIRLSPPKPTGPSQEVQSKPADTQSHLPSLKGAIRLVSLEDLVAEAEQPPQSPTTLSQQQVQTREYGELPLVPIPESAWERVPTECVARMLEFQSVRDEYRRTYDSEPPEKLRDPSPHLTLEAIVELALLNSREYQTEKERLYRAALALTLERFDYELKFSPTGNGTDVNYDHLRSDGRTVNTLSVPSTFQAEKMLVTGGQFLARFANDVVLTFNGPDGFASDISSELLFELTQTVFQRDILLEPLIQTERNVVYAARDFARFRKDFFFRLASQYYALIRTYRQIEIEAQNYFSLVRAFDQAEEEERVGLRSRIQVEQIEQDLLQGRSRLITACNRVESDLDRLNIVMGLPTETPINLDLTELDELTVGDQIDVNGELVHRARIRADTQRQKTEPDRGEVLNAAVVLVERLLDWLSLRQRIGQVAPELESLEELHLRLRVDEARLEVDGARDELETAREAEPPAPPILLYQRTMDLIDTLLELATRQLALAEHLRIEPDLTAQFRARHQELTKLAIDLRDRLRDILEKAQLEQMPELQREAEQLLGEVDRLVIMADRLTGAPAQRPSPEEELQQTLEQTDTLIEQAGQLLDTAEVGLVSIQIDVDDAMMTALVERLDLMNQRGRLADDRRVVKLAADDLKSLLDLRAAQRIRTKKNRPFGFTFDNSNTTLNLSLDLPLNRRAQRNDYRLSLIDYQVGLRDLMALEDNVKLAVRDELRNLALARVQYQISVASAALAAERVRSTRLELALGFPGVAARDFLEAQDASRSALGNVADNHIGYIVERARFFLDLELMQLDQGGFWPELYDERYQPTPHYELPLDAGPPYGDIPAFLKVSPEIRRTVRP